MPSFEQALKSLLEEDISGSGLIIRRDYFEPNDGLPEEHIQTNQDLQDQDQDDEKFYIPTQEELDKHIEENRVKEQEEKKNQALMQNQTHGKQCKDCEKATNMTPNPAAVMRYCKFNGVMVSKFQTCCDKFKLSNRPKDPWEPEL